MIAQDLGADFPREGVGSQRCPAVVDPGLTTSASAAISPILRVRGLVKRFGATVALAGVDLDVAPGEVIGLMGENGAGKSTLVGALSGVLQPDAGQIELGGRRAVFRNAHDAQVSGMATVYQHLALAPHLSVAENLYLGRMGPLAGVVSPSQLRERAAATLRELGWAIDVDRPVGTLPTSDQQLVEVARAIASRVRVLLLDEPTSSLTPTEVGVLLRRVRELAAGGISVIFVSHQLDEVFDVVDSFAVLRDGRVALRCAKNETDRETVVHAMLGTEHAPTHAGQRTAGRAATSSTGERVFEIDRWSRPPAFHDISLSLGTGDVLALTGLRGCGAVEVAAGLFNQGSTESQVRCFGRHGPLSTTDLISIGIGYVPADRRQALFPDLSLRENLELARRVAHAASVSSVESVVARLAIRARDADVPLRHLSGGNQQKVLIGRWLVGRVRALILVEPTRGVDIGVRADIHRLIVELADDGLGILMVSFDADEIEATARRVAIMHNGRIERILEEDLNARRILRAVAAAASATTQRTVA